MEINRTETNGAARPRAHLLKETEKTKNHAKTVGAHAPHKDTGRGNAATCSAHENQRISARSESRASCALLYTSVGLRPWSASGTMRCTGEADGDPASRALFTLYCMTEPSAPPLERSQLLAGSRTFVLLSLLSGDTEKRNTVERGVQHTSSNVPDKGQRRNAVCVVAVVKRRRVGACRRKVVQRKAAQIVASSKDARVRLAAEEQRARR